MKPHIRLKVPDNVFALVSDEPYPRLVEFMCKRHAEAIAGQLRAVFMVCHFAESVLAKPFGPMYGALGASATNSVLAVRQKLNIRCASLASQISERRYRLPSTHTSSPYTGTIGMNFPNHGLVSRTSAPVRMR